MVSLLTALSLLCFAASAFPAPANVTIEERSTTGRASSGSPGAWMAANLGTIGSAPLGKVALPGSHDAGMSALTGGTFGAVPCNTLTQTLPIAGQLAAGARYFDIRPVITGGAFATGHYSFVSQIDSWQGGNGQSMASIVSDVNAFTASNAEVVILNLSHDLDTDLGNANYAPLTQAQWTSLIGQLEGLNHRLTADRLPPGTDPTSVDLTTLSVNSLIGSGQAAVIVVLQPDGANLSLGQFAAQGFFEYAQYNAVNQFSDTESLDTMASDQLAKMAANSGALFLLSWTLTQNTADTLDCIFGGKSILTLAQTANTALYSRLPAAATAQVYPKIVYVDKFDDSAIVPLSLGLALKALGQ